jgi:predicted transcriptional regulator of viral defense system
MGDGMKKQAQPQLERAKRLFRQRGGLLRTSEAIRVGIHPRTLYAMRSAGTVERLGRGLYRLTEMPPLGNPDLVSVAARVPQGVICLVSALAFHEITTQIPHEVYLALKRGAERPRLAYPPVRVFWYSGPSVTEGVEIHEVDGIGIRIYSPEKTLADCFKYRNKIGLETAIEALRLYRSRKRVQVDDLMRFARVCRVVPVMRPYLEALL